MFSSLGNLRSSQSAFNLSIVWDTENISIKFRLLTLGFVRRLALAQTTRPRLADQTSRNRTQPSRLAWPITEWKFRKFMNEGVVEYRAEGVVPMYAQNGVLNTVCFGRASSRTGSVTGFSSTRSGSAYGTIRPVAGAEKSVKYSTRVWRTRWCSGSYGEKEYCDRADGELKIRFVGHCRNEICTRVRRAATYTLRRGWCGVIGGTKMIVIATVVTARNFATLYSVERRKQNGHERADRTSLNNNAIKRLDAEKHPSTTTGCHIRNTSIEPCLLLGGVPIDIAWYARYWRFERTAKRKQNSIKSATHSE